MNEFVDLPRLYEAIRVVSVIVIAIATILFAIWFSRWATTENASWQRALFGTIVLICSLIFMVYNFLGSVP